MIPLCSPQEAQRPTALALGSFDGLHVGHRQVIRQAIADTRAVPSVVSFWPHPREVLYGEPRLRLDLPNEKLSLLEPLGIRQLVLVDNNMKIYVGAFSRECLRARSKFAWTHTSRPRRARV